MARPRKEGMDYFPHDVHLSDDKKVIALRTLHGNDGYAFYGIMLECIYQEPNFELDVSDAETIQILSRKVEVTQEKFAEMLKTAIKHRCFDQERYANEGILTSNGIKKRASVVVEKRVAMRDKYVSGVVSDAEIGVESTQSKSKVKVKALKDIVSMDDSAISFETFWNAYPTKGSNKKMSLTKWNTLWKANKIDMDEMLKGVSDYVNHQEKKSYDICAAQVFLNQERWKDDWGISKGSKQRKYGEGWESPI